MNWLAIILSVILLIVLYYVFTFYTSDVSTLAKSADLSVGNVPSIPHTNINSPGSANFAYGIWLYVVKAPENGWIYAVSDTDQTKDITTKFSKDTPNANVEVGLAINPSTAELYAVYGGQNYVVTNNFPFQKWVHVIISYDTAGRFIDLYLDGKMISSIKDKITDGSKSADVIYKMKTDTFFFGKGNVNVGALQHWTTSMDPQTAWSTYLKAAGIKVNPINQYGVGVDLYKNNDVTYQQRII